MDAHTCTHAHMYTYTHRHTQSHTNNIHTVFDSINERKHGGVYLTVFCFTELLERVNLVLHSLVFKISIL